MSHRSLRVSADKLLASTLRVHTLAGERSVGQIVMVAASPCFPRRVAEAEADGTHTRGIPSCTGTNGDDAVAASSSVPASSSSAAAAHSDRISSDAVAVFSAGMSICRAATAAPSLSLLLRCTRGLDRLGTALSVTEPPLLDTRRERVDRLKARSAVDLMRTPLDISGNMLPAEFNSLTA